jgi:hypothetical protein
VKGFTNKPIDVVSIYLSIVRGVETDVCCGTVCDNGTTQQPCCVTPHVLLDTFWWFELEVPFFPYPPFDLS